MSEFRSSSKIKARAKADAPQVEETTAEENRLTHQLDPNDPSLPVSFPEPILDQPAGYEIIRELGRGGMAIVYMAREVKLNRIVALKMLRSGSQASPDELNRFRQEAETVARLTHTNIVRIHLVAEHLGIPFLSLELLEGGNLEELIDGHPQSPKLAARIVEALARGVEAAHQQGIIHRDLKPSNILLAQDGTPKITDFGVAKLSQFGRPTTQTGIVMGTPCYIAPEQARGDRELTPSVDVYSLGAILYEMLTGRPPHNGPTPVDTLLQVVENEPIPPGKFQANLDRDLEVICLRCLEKSPARRYGSAQDLAEDLKRYQNREPILARPVHQIERLYRWCRRHPRETGLAVTALLCLFVTLSLFDSVARLRRERVNQAKQNQTQQTARFDAHIAEYRRWREQALNEKELPDRLALFGMADSAIEHAKVALTTIRDSERQAILDSLLEESERDRGNEQLLKRLAEVRLEVSLSMMKHLTLNSDFPQNYEGVQRYLQCLKEWQIDPHEASVADLSKPLNLHPKSIRLALVDAFDHLAILESDPSRRRNCLLLAASIDPSSVRNHLRGHFAEDDGDSLRKMARGSRLLEDEPRTALLLGNLLVALGDEELAESYLRQAIERFPDDFWLNHDLAIHLLGGIKQNPEQAVRAMSVARALRAREKIVDFHLGLTLKLAQRNEEAVRVLKLVVAAIPHLEEARDLLARAYDDLGDLKATIESLKESLTVLPESSVLRYRLGHALKRAGKLLEAEAQFQRLLSSEAQRAEDYSCRALALYHLGLGRESLVELQEGHRHFPSHYLLAFNLAEGYRLSGREAESRELFAEAAKLEPSQPYAHRKAGLALVRNRQYREAQPYLEKAYRLEPLRIDTLAALAKCYAMAGQVAEGDRLFRELLTKLPDQSYLQLEYGHFLREANRLDESRKIFEPLCRREPFNLSAHRGLSLLLQKQTRFEEAEKLLKVLFDRAKDDRSSLDRIRPWLREAESLTRRHLDWERYRREGQLPEEAWERLALAQFVEEWFPEPEATLRLYQSAFEKHPRLLHDPKTSARIQAARAAIRLVGTQSQVEEQQRFRRLTREWLELEVRLIELKLNSLEPHEVEHSRQRIDLLLSEPAFEPVRSLQSIETLSETEYVEWQAIWDRLRRFKER